MSNFLVMEYHAHDVPWWDSLVVGGATIVGGFIHLNDKPGHGLELDEDVARAHLAPGTSYFRRPAMIVTQDIQRPPAGQIAALKALGGRDRRVDPAQDGPPQPAYHADRLRGRRAASWPAPR